MNKLFLFCLIFFLIFSLSCSNATKPIYIISDNINNYQVDDARIDQLVQLFKSVGVTDVYNAGVGTDNIGILEDLPENSSLIMIVGGADAGMIFEMGTNYYKNLKGNRTVYLIFVDPAVNINGLEYLERSYDDNFSPEDFTGLSHPDQYLKENGYGFFYWDGNDTKEMLEDFKKCSS